MQCSSFQCFDEKVLSQDVNTDTDTYTKGFKSNFQRGQKSHKNPLTLESQTPNSPPCDMTDLVAGITCVPSPTLPQDPFALLLLSNCSNSSQYSVLVVCFLCVCACADALEEKKKSMLTDWKTRKQTDTCLPSCHSLATRESASLLQLSSHCGLL